MPIPEHTINKVVYDGHTLIDLTGDTITANTILAGYTGHDRSGNPVTGTFDPSVYVLKAGDTMTGTLNLTNSSVSINSITSSKAFAIKASSGSELYLQFSATGNQGIWSSGYATSLTDSSTYTESGSWIIQRSGSGEVYIPIWGNKGTSSRPIYFNADGVPVAMTGSDIINGLGEATAAAQRDDFIVAQAAGGGTTTTTYYRRALKNIFKALNSSDITTALGYTPPQTDANVTQTDNSENKNFRILLSNTNADTTETAGVKKSSKLYFNPSTGSANFSGNHNSTSNVASTFSLGNSLASEAAGKCYGVLKLFSRNGNYIQIVDNPTTPNTVDVNLYPPNSSGTIALTSDLSSYLPLTGGTLTGALTLSGAPTSNLHAATKKYVDDSIGALDGSITGSAGAGKTLTAFSETNGVVTATFGNISITKSQVSDFPTLATVATSGSYNDLSNKPSLDYLPLSGGTLTGTLNVTNKDIKINSVDANRGIGIYSTAGVNLVLYSVKAGNHGVYSTGYGSDLTDPTKVHVDSGDAIWIIRRSSLGNVYVPEWKDIGSATSPIYMSTYGRPVACTSIPSSLISGDFVTSVAVTGSKGISISGSPITSSGTIDVSVSTSSGTPTRNTTNTSAGAIKYTKYGRVVTVYSTTWTTINSTGAALSKNYYTGLPKPSAAIQFITSGPSRYAYPFQLTTDGYIQAAVSAPTAGDYVIAFTYISSS